MTPSLSRSTALIRQRRATDLAATRRPVEFRDRAAGSCSRCWAVENSSRRRGSAPGPEPHPTRASASRSRSSASSIRAGRVVGIRFLVVLKYPVQVGGDLLVVERHVRSGTSVVVHLDAQLGRARKMPPLLTRWVARLWRSRCRLAPGTPAPAASRANRLDNNLRRRHGRGATGSAREQPIIRIAVDGPALEMPFSMITVVALSVIRRRRPLLVAVIPHAKTSARCSTPTRRRHGRAAPRSSPRRAPS